jgi:hypothetical protein
MTKVDWLAAAALLTPSRIGMCPKKIAYRRKTLVFAITGRNIKKKLKRGHHKKFKTCRDPCLGLDL